MSKLTTVYQKHESRSWRERWYEIIFEADTPAGKLFDVLLLIAILLSVLVVMCESVDFFSPRAPRAAGQGRVVLSRCCSQSSTVCGSFAPAAQCAISFSFYGIVDLLAILPTYIIALPIFEGGQGAQTLAVIRALRLLRAFRIFKLAHMLSEASALREAMWAARAKVAVFLSVRADCRRDRWVDDAPHRRWTRESEGRATATEGGPESRKAKRPRPDSTRFRKACTGPS